jgi:hypothetical protein
MVAQDREWEWRLEDRLELLRYAPRDRALEILRLILDNAYGEGFRHGVDSARTIADSRPRLRDETPPRQTGTGVVSSD